MNRRSTLLALLLMAACDESAGRDAALDGALDGSTDSPGSETNGADGRGDVGDAGLHDDGGGACQGVTCTGNGTCVVVQAQPTCACASGYYRVGLACQPDPCSAGGSCLYVDSAAGNDGRAGSRTAPWKTLARVKQVMSGLAPGNFVLLHRGGDWTQESLNITGVKGTADHPVTFGAYGPLTLARPLLSKINLTSSSHVTIRDVEVTLPTSGPCISVSYTDHPIVQDTVVHHCASNGILFGGATSYGVMVDNLAYEIKANDALVIHSPMEITATSKVGDHHWIVDNRVPGPAAEQAVDVATGNDTFEGAKDIKIVGNRLARGKAGCIMLGHGTSVAWVVGNLLGNCPTAETAAPLSIGGQHGANSGTRFQVRGNLVFWNLMADRIISETPQVMEAVVEQNTFVTTIGKRVVLSAQYPAGKLSLQRNILWTTGSQGHVSFSADAKSSISAMDHNWYIPGTNPACSIGGTSLTQWQASSGFDASSACASVPGPSLAPQPPQSGLSPKAP